MRIPSIVKSLLAGSWGPGPVFRYEVVMMRVVFAGVLYDWLPAALGFPEQPHPVGVARWFDLSWVSDHYGWIRLAFGALLLPYVIGIGLPVVLPLLAAIHIAIYTLYNSQGFVTHSVQVVSQVLLAQALVVVFFALWRRLTGKPFAFRDGLTRDSYWLYFSQGVIVFSYVTSAVTKLLRSDGRWLQDLPNMPLGLLRTRLSAHFSDPTGPPPEAPPLAGWLIDHPMAAVWMFGPGLFIELFAFLALRNRLMALLVGCSLIALHEGIALVMKLDFRLNKWGALIFLINVPWWLWWMVRGRRQPVDAMTGPPP